MNEKTPDNGTAVVHWRCYRTKSGNYKATAYQGGRTRAKCFFTFDEAAAFVSVMKKRPMAEQVAWLFTTKRRVQAVYSVAGRMKTEWAKTHPQVRVVGGWRGRPCGGGNVGIHYRSFAAVYSRS